MVSRPVFEVQSSQSMSRVISIDRLSRLSFLGYFKEISFGGLVCSRLKNKKKYQETFLLKNSGDFFRKIVIVDGNAKAWTEEDGIMYVGVIPFLLGRGGTTC